MKKEKRRKPRKELSTAVKILLILMFSLAFLFLGICIGFLINSFINYSIRDIQNYAFFTLLVGIGYMLLLIILIQSKDKENEKPFKWYFNGILISLTLTFIITALTVFSLGVEEDNVINYLVGAGIFPLIGIITTINIIKYVKKDTLNWKNICYSKGNLHKIRDSKDYYRVQTPVSFEKKILSAVYKGQFLNVLVVIGVMLMVIASGIHYMGREHIYTGEIIRDLIELKAKRLFGVIFFLMILFAAFGIPIIAYYVGNALKKIRVVRKHEYIAYHVIASGVRDGKITVFDGNKRYSYNYCTCVGIKEKDVHFTPATLIFIPDDVLLFPDNEEYKVEEYKKVKKS